MINDDLKMMHLQFLDSYDDIDYTFEQILSRDYILKQLKEKDFDELRIRPAINDNVIRESEMLNFVLGLNDCCVRCGCPLCLEDEWTTEYKSELCNKCEKELDGEIRPLPL